MSCSKVRSAHLARWQMDPRRAVPLADPASPYGLPIAAARPDTVLLISHSGRIEDMTFGGDLFACSAGAALGAGAAPFDRLRQLLREA